MDTYTLFWSNKFYKLRIILNCKFFNIMLRIPLFIYNF